MTSFQLSMELVSLDYSAQPVVHRPGFFIFIFFSDSLFKSCFFFLSQHIKHILLK